MSLLDILRPQNPPTPKRVRPVEMLDRDGRPTLTCRRCGMAKHKDEFYKSDRGRCKECIKIGVRANRERNIEHYRAFDKARATAPERVAARAAYMQTPDGKAAHARATRKHNAAHQKQRHAINVLWGAVSSGRIIPWPVCALPECDRTDVHGHHADYDEPLLVTWLCPLHHKQAHAIGRGISGQAM